jgi:hypothetical protein
VCATVIHSDLLQWSALLLQYLNFILADASSHPWFHGTRAEGTLDLQDDLRYQEVPVKIIDTMMKKTRTKAFNLCKVHWSKHTEAEAAWEKEDALREEFPHMFEEHTKSRGRDSI